MYIMKDETDGGRLLLSGNQIIEWSGVESASTLKFDPRGAWELASPFGFLTKMNIINK